MEWEIDDLFGKNDDLSDLFLDDNDYNDPTYNQNEVIVKALVRHNLLWPNEDVYMQKFGLGYKQKRLLGKLISGLMTHFIQLFIIFTQQLRIQLV